MEQFVIEGGHPISGTIKAGGNKNAAIKMIPACLLTEEPVTLRNMPNIGDVRITLDIMRQLGAEVTWLDNNTVRIHAATITTSDLDPALATKIRASVVFAGPMLARCGQVRLPIPGGDSIGERRLDTHAIALQKLGAVVTLERDTLIMRTDGLQGADILLNEASVTATENAIMAAVRAKGKTTIRNTACEPHILDLCTMLITLGAKIEGAGTNRIIIEGVDQLHGGEARVGADYMEVGSFIGAAVLTGGELLITDADPQHLEMIALTFARLGVQWETRGQDIFLPAAQSLTIVPDMGNRMPIIKAQPWPAFPPDLMSIALVIATQCAGAVLFHDWMYESRFFFTDKLVRMGARITLLDPHRVLVQGPTSLQGQPYITSPDIRAGMAILLAALGAKGQTRIFNIRQIDRGYERVEEKLRALGAHIERVEDKHPGIEEPQEIPLAEH
ncbi:MAG: UDP-N-acetylglucosamine 1-carboxyvinyltransferase [Chloroflexi bacterium]|nr:UDP-N-acetylglucosamine 1-carboxyvinyltransferase [Chloroflexota bacterium]MCC6893513.1 UDP-N-acetylglucosamine 1-carboxyvinyltransferase [Anaerolineae bacterium]